MLTRRGFLGVATLAGATASTGCGYLLYPERVGQKVRGTPNARIDPMVVVLDGLLCLCFLLPGVIAFVVDVGTGALYFPAAAGGQTAERGWEAVPLPDTSRASIEAAVRAYTGVDVRLDDPALRAVAWQGRIDAETVAAWVTDSARVPTQRVVPREDAQGAIRDFSGAA